MAVVEVGRGEKKDGELHYMTDSTLGLGDHEI